MLVDAILPSYDIQQTTENARRVLKNYAKYKRMAIASNHVRLTTKMSNDPHNRGDYRYSKVEGASIQTIKAQEVIDNINQALELLSETSYKRIYSKYINQRIEYDYVIYIEENISKSTFYREHKEALIEFAELYNNGELLAFEDAS